MDPALIRIVAFLNREKILATYDAVVRAAGVPTRSAGRQRCDRRAPHSAWQVRECETDTLASLYAPLPGTGVVRVDPFFAKIIASSRAACV
jgi:hypothetical protein